MNSVSDIVVDEKTKIERARSVDPQSRVARKATRATRAAEST
jgi:hypothetical protein